MRNMQPVKDCQMFKCNCYYIQNPFLHTTLFFLLLRNLPFKKENDHLQINFHTLFKILKTLIFEDLSFLENTSFHLLPFLSLFIKLDHLLLSLNEDFNQA